VSPAIGLVNYLKWMLKRESAINFWIPPPTSETLKNHCNGKDSPLEEEIQIAFSSTSPNST
jgi:hypothetical protein